MSAPCLSLLFFIFSFSFLSCSIQNGYEIQEDISNFSNIENVERENLALNHINHDNISTFKKRLKIFRMPFSIDENYPNCHNVYCNRPLATEEMKNIFCKSCFLHYKTVKKSLRKRIKALNEPTRNKNKLGIIKDYPCDIILDKDFPNCRNQFCKKLLIKTDRRLICENCCRYYENSKGQLRGKNKLIQIRKKKRQTKGNQKNNEKGKKRKTSKRNQNPRHFDEFEQSKKTRNHESTENGFEKFDKVSNLSPVPIPFTISLDSPLPLIQQSFEQEWPMLDSEKIIENEKNILAPKSHGLSRDDAVYPLRNCNSNNNTNSETGNGDFFESLLKALLPELNKENQRKIH